MPPLAPEPLPLRLRLVVPPGLAALEPARQSVHAFLAGRVHSTRALYRLDLVLEESLMNRMWHAHPLGQSADTRVQVDLTPDELRLRFEDDGVAFDPTTADLPAAPEHLADASPGGRGLLLTKKSAQAWAYERQGSTNVFTVVLALE